MQTGALVPWRPGADDGPGPSWARGGGPSRLACRRRRGCRGRVAPRPPLQGASAPDRRRPAHCGVQGGEPPQVPQSTNRPDSWLSRRICGARNANHSARLRKCLCVARRWLKVMVIRMRRSAADDLCLLDCNKWALRHIRGMTNHRQLGSTFL